MSFAQIQSIVDQLPEDERRELAEYIWNTLPRDETEIDFDDPTLKSQLDARLADDTGSMDWTEVQKLR